MEQEKSNKKCYQVSRRRIRRVMKSEGLVSSYTIANYKPLKDKNNNSKISNVLDKNFNEQSVHNVVINGILNTFVIKRSLSRKGCPYDNAVAEATFKIIKTEFVKNNVFKTLKELKIKFGDYVNWFNKIRMHSSLGYMSPCEYSKSTLKKVV
ncbi:transposase InsO family protein [Fusobacterium sp. PH5-44]